MEPTVGFEPTTCGLRNRCSTTELRWLYPSTAPFLAFACLSIGPFDTNIDTNAAHNPGQRAAAPLSLGSF